MDQEIRNKLRNVVTQCRKLLEESVSQELEGKYGIFAKKDQVTADPNAKMTHLTDEERAARQDILDHLGHIKARGFKPKEALDQLIREIAFTHLNRLCAYKMMEAREVYVGGQKFREAVTRGINSNGVKFYLAANPEEERLFNTGHQDVAYRHFLDWLGGALSDEIGVLFNPTDPANRLYPRQKTLDEVLDLLNHGGIKAEETELREEWPKIWSQDETIGWIYQYFTPKELRDVARDPKKGGSSAPRNSYELAFRNQFFTPRYVVEFLTDNTLGRIWYEMRKGDTKIKDQCRYLVRRPNEIFLSDGEQAPDAAAGGPDNFSQEELLKLPVHIPHRPKKDPRELKILDPACGSGHFLLYCFDLLLTIYEEAYADSELGQALQKDYPKLEDLRRDVPRLILAHNLHGIDIDLRCTQIAALALWLRCQRAYQEMELKKDRPKIKRSNFVCAEPMPGEEQMLKEFVDQLEPKLLGQMVEVVFHKMKLAGEAGSLLKIEEEIRDAVAAAKKQWVRDTSKAIDRKGQPLLFTQAEMDRLRLKPEQPSLFDLTDITDDQFFERAEAEVIEALRQYAEKAQNGQRLQRRLFTEDALQGFAFVDLCQKQYDAVLMNPPFGEAQHQVRPLLGGTYANWGNDLYVAFGSRALSLLNATGAVGAITSRLGFFLSSFGDWRVQEILSVCHVHAFADLGYGVLDEALVEVAAWTLHRQSPSGTSSVFLRLLGVKEKDPHLLTAINDLSAGRSQESITYFAHQETMSFVEGSPFCYWVSETLRRLLGSLPTMSSIGGDARQGMSTADDERFLRLAWEAPVSEIGSQKRWVHFAKGGEYTPFYDDIHLLVYWDKGNAPLKEAGAFLRNQRFYLLPGVTYSQRSTSAYNAKLLPAGCIFSTGGHGVFASGEQQTLLVLAILVSRIINVQIEMAVGSGDDAHSGSAARNYLNGLINVLRCPVVNGQLATELAAVAGRLVNLARLMTTWDETSRLFVCPQSFVGDHHSCIAVARARLYEKEAMALSILEHYAKLDDAVSAAFGIPESVNAEIDSLAGSLVDHFPKKVEVNPNVLIESMIMTIPALIELIQKEQGSARYISKKAYTASRRLELVARRHSVHPQIVVDARRRSGVLPDDELAVVAKDVISYGVGVAFGRWDVQYAVGNKPLPSLSKTFAELPNRSPGMLLECDGAATVSLKGYPIHVGWDGILVDDPDHSNDILQHVREVLEAVWRDKAEGVEKEASETLDMKGLRDYFRKPGNGGFWNDHVSRYSKSRRSAPIYWLLQSSRKNYALWVYYHRLDKDLLFKALVNYVEPKIRLETSRLESVRGEKAVAGDSGKEAKRLAEEVEQQEDFLSELRDFEDKLRRAANLQLVPDLNDGVVLNIAPLYELVPWKEAKNYWEALLKGEYEWSSIGRQLRQKGLSK